MSESDAQNPKLPPSANEIERLRAQNEALQAENERLRRERERDEGENRTVRRRAVIWLLRCAVTFLVAILLEEFIHELFSPEVIRSLQNTAADFIGAIGAVNPLTVGLTFLGSITNELFELHHINPFVIVLNGAIAAWLKAYSEGPLAAILVGIALLIGFSWAYSASHESFVWTLVTGPVIAFAMLLVLMLFMVICWLLLIGGIAALGAVAVITGSLPVVWHYVLLTVYKRTSMDFEDRIAERLIRLM
jgi:hypothetical protein